MPTDIFTLLTFLASGGAAAGIAWLIENLAPELDSRLKATAGFVLTLLVSAGAIWLKSSVDKVSLDALNPYVSLSLALLPVFLNQIVSSAYRRREVKELRNLNKQQ